jgi:putative tryptophan/tyrosine transport system substrate-binding protein
LPYSLRIPVLCLALWLIAATGGLPLIPIPLSRAQTGANLVGILISQEIRPFIQMVEGLEERLGPPACRIFLDEKETPYSQDPRFEAMEPGRFEAMVAVGPRALSFLIQKNWPSPILYGMVLNPERFAPKDVPVCGVSLNLDPLEQLTLIQATFPEVKRIGVLFDPANNQEWFEKARMSATSTPVSLVPLASSNRTDLTSVIREKRTDVDAILFIPDSTVISKALIQHLIKEAFLLGIPAVGYNLFFHESGAALSFVVDYRWVGERVAALVEAVSREGPCAPSGPGFKAVLHRGVVRTLGLKLASPLPAAVEEN